MTVVVIGNPDIRGDSLPLRILPELQRRFPAIRMLVWDPNEEWGFGERAIVIDTVFGIDRVTVFPDLTAFLAPPRITTHDADALLVLRALEKLGIVNEVHIIGIPPTISEGEAIEEVGTILTRATQP